MNLPRPVFLRPPIAREITWVIVIKLVAIAAIYFVFFAGRAAQPDADAVAEHLTHPQEHAEQ